MHLPIIRHQVERLPLNRVSERTSFLNILGEYLLSNNVRYIEDRFNLMGNKAFGPAGFIEFLYFTIPYSDPAMKKIIFFLEIMHNTCDWKIKDYAQLKSPIDYHEMRGHLRLETLALPDNFKHKISRNIPLSIEEDNELRISLQDVNDQISQESNITNGQLHYFLWNIFRNCCPSDPRKRHCRICDQECGLPENYRIVQSGCFFGEVCTSSGKETTVIEPAYYGHYY